MGWRNRMVWLHNELHARQNQRWHVQQTITPLAESEVMVGLCLGMNVFEVCCLEGVTPCVPACLPACRPACLLCISLVLIYVFAQLQRAAEILVGQELVAIDSSGQVRNKPQLRGLPGTSPVHVSVSCI